MASVGQQLRDARMRLGVSLEEVSAKTRITLRILEAIEKDDVSRLGAPFFYRSFVRQFAEYVQLCYSDLAAAVQSATDSLPQPAMPAEGAGYSPKLAPLRARRAKSRWFYSAGSFVIMLAACSTFSAVWQKSRASGEHASVVHRAAVGQEYSAGARQPVPKTEQPPAAIPPAVVSNAADAAFHIELSAIEPTWLSIVADGKRTFSGILRTTQTKILEGHEIARIHTGNAGGVSVVFNGKAIGRLGLRGQVLTAVFTKDRYEIVERPAHMALLRFSLSGE